MKKSKTSEALYTDSVEVKAAKMVLDSCCNEMESVLSTLKMLHYVETKHVAAINAFSSTVHSTIDLGPQRGATNTHYFGQYLKMMASSMSSVEKTYIEFVAAIKQQMIDPLSLWDLQENDIQNCKNLKYEYGKLKSEFNLNPSSEARMKLADIEHRFIADTKALRLKRERILMPKITMFHSKLIEFAAEQSKFINEKRVINGYDEMKMAKQEMVQKVVNEMVHIESDEQFAAYLKDNVLGDGDTTKKLTKWTLIMFHRDRFPPSMKFLMECFFPLCTKYNAQSGNDVTLKFISVGYKCTDILEQYEIDAFPTCLVFEGDTESTEFDAVIGNSEESRSELGAIVNKLALRIATERKLKLNGD